MTGLYEKPDRCMTCNKVMADDEGSPLTNYFIWCCTISCFLDYRRECVRQEIYEHNQPWDY